jgi:hypothetical protein
MTECHHKQKAAEMEEKFFELNPAEERTRFQKIYIFKQSHMYLSIMGENVSLFLKMGQ